MLRALPFAASFATASSQLSAWKTAGPLNCYMASRPFDHGARDNLANGAAVQVEDRDDCVQQCIDQHYWQFKGCQYVVFNAAEKKCYPRRGLQCSKCDYDRAYSLEVPKSMYVGDCPGNIPDWKTVEHVNCYMTDQPYDHGARENLANGAAVFVSDKDECVHKCATQDGRDFQGCEYVVFHAADSQCYPRAGLKCSKCDYNVEYSLITPKSMSTRDCPASAPSWKTVRSLNCYMAFQPYDHGARENLANGAAVFVNSKDDCTRKCAAQEGSDFQGCEYVVFHAEDNLCYPRAGLKCSNCDYNVEYSLEVPPSMSTEDCHPGNHIWSASQPESLSNSTQASSGHLRGSSAR